MSYSTSQAILGDGSSLGHSTTQGGSYTDLGEITKIGLPKGSAPKVKVTNMQSPNRKHEYISGFIEPGEVEVEMNWLKAEYKWARANQGVAMWFKITIPVNGGSSDYTETFPGFIMEVEGDVPVESQVTSKIKICVTGDSTIA